MRVRQEREREIRQAVEKWKGRTACQFSPHMLMCRDLITLLDSARDANARMMVELLRHDEGYLKAEAEAARTQPDA